MSLPFHLQVGEDTFFESQSLSTDTDFVYLRSLKRTQGISENSLSETCSSTNANLQPLQQYGNLVEFNPETYRKLREESKGDIQSECNQATRSLYLSLTEYHLRSSLGINNHLSSIANTPFALVSDFYNTTYEEMSDMALRNWSFDKIKGNNPNQWPIDLDEFISSILELPLFSFFLEPDEVHLEFLSKVHNIVKDLVPQVQSGAESVDFLVNVLFALFLVVFNKGQFPAMLELINFITTEAGKLTQENQENPVFKQLFIKIDEILERANQFMANKKDFHYMRSLCDIGGFQIANVSHFQKIGFSNSSLTSDGAYLYLYVGVNNGGMYKIGTGEKGTIAGKIYIFQAVNCHEQVSWVYLKEKLYLRSSLNEIGSVQIFCPHTFKSEGCIQLHCPEIFSHPSLQMINQKFQLLTEGKNLYIIGKTLISEKLFSEDKPPVVAVQLASGSMSTSIEQKLTTDEQNDMFSEMDLKLVKSGDSEIGFPSPPFNVDSFSQSQQQTYYELRNIIQEDESALDNNQFEDVPQKIMQLIRYDIQKKHFKQRSKYQEESSPSIKSKQNAQKPSKKVSQDAAEQKQVPGTEENMLKLLEYYLYEFDINQPVGQESINENQSINSDDLIQELFESFSGYFTMNECKKAMSISKDDIGVAAQWLVEQGEQERSKKIILMNSQVLLLQAQVVSDISSKALKANNGEVILQEDSILFPNTINQNIWTMDENYVTAYTQYGVKIFSKNPEDVQVIDINSQDLSNHFQGGAIAPGGIGKTNIAELHRQYQDSNMFGGGKATFNSFVNNNSLNKFPGSLHNPFEAPPKNVPGWGTNESIFTKQAALPSGAVVENASIFNKAMEQPNKPIKYAVPIPPNDSMVFKGFGLNDSPGMGQQFGAPDSLNEKLSAPKMNTTEIPSPQSPQKPVFQLKGSLVQTISDNQKRNWYPNPNYNICYQPETKKFYTFTWRSTSNSNRFPSLITVSYDYNSYADDLLAVLDPPCYQNSAATTTVNSNTSSPSQSPRQKDNFLESSEEKKSLSQEEQDMPNFNEFFFRESCLRSFLKLQRFRFKHPSRFNRWDYIFQFTLQELNNRKQNSEESNQQFATLRGKLIQRLNRVLEQNADEIKIEKEKFEKQESVYRETQRIYAACMDGSQATFDFIYEAIVPILQSFSLLSVPAIVDKIKQKSIEIRELILFLQYIRLWSLHADILVNLKDNFNSKMQNLLTNITLLLKNINTPHLNESSEQIKIVGFINELLINIIVDNFYTFGKTNEQQAKLIQLFRDLEQSRQEAKILSDSPFKLLGKKVCFSPITYDREFPFRDNLIQKLNPINGDKIHDKIDPNVNTNELLNRNRHIKLRSESFAEPIGRLLIKNLSFVNHLRDDLNTEFQNLYTLYFADVTTKQIEEYENIKKLNQQNQSLQRSSNLPPVDDIKYEYASKDRITQHQEVSQSIWNILEKGLLSEASKPSSSSIESSGSSSDDEIRNFAFQLFESSWGELTQIASTNCEWEARIALITEFSQIISIVLENLKSQVNEAYDCTSVTKWLVLSISQLTQATLLSSAGQNPSNCQFIEVFLNLLKKMKQVIDTIQGGTLLMESLQSSHCEGVDQFNQKTFETNHPYEQGQSVSFENFNFPGAIALVIEFDQRCQSDNNHDFLNLNSWHDYHNASIGGNINNRDVISSSFRVTGKPNISRPTIMLGNILSVEFNPSAQAREQSSITKWGFKGSVRPIYGIKTSLSQSLHVFLKKTEYKPILKKFGTENNLQNWLNNMKLLDVCIINQIQSLIEYDSVADKERELNSLLRWSVFKNGISGIKIDQYLELIEKQGSHSSQTWKLQENASLNMEQLQLIVDYKLKEESGRQHDRDNNLSLKEELISKIINSNDFLSDNGDFITELKKNTEIQTLLDDKKQPIIDPESFDSISWDSIDVSNPLISKYVKEIKDQSGQFYEFITEVRKQMPNNSNYIQAKMRKATFAPEYQQMWEKAEGMLLLVSLYHAGLLGQDLKVLQNEMHFLEDTYRGLINKLLEMVEGEREWKHALQSLTQRRLAFLEIKQERMKQQMIEQEQNKIKELEEKEQKQLEEEAQKAKDSLENGNSQAPAPAGSVNTTNAQSVSQMPQIVKSGKTIQIVGGFNLNASQSAPAAVAAPKKKTQKNKDQIKSVEVNVTSSLGKNDPKEQPSLKSVESTSKSIDVITKQVQNAPVKLQKFETELIDAFWDEFKQRFEAELSASHILKIVCASRNIEFDDTDLISTQKKLFNELTTVLQSCEKNPDNEEIIMNFRSPYEKLATLVIQRLIFLLFLSNHKELFRKTQVEESQKQPQIMEESANLFKKSQNNQPSVEKSEDQELDFDIGVPGLQRSFSSNVTSSTSVEKNKQEYQNEKLEELRKEVDYQRWKGLMKHTKDDDESSFTKDHPSSILQSIVAFSVNLQVDPEEIRTILERQNQRIAKRIVGLNTLNNLIITVKGTWQERYVLGMLTSVFEDDCFRYVNCACEELQVAYSNLIVDLLTQLIDIFGKTYQKISDIKMNEMSSFLFQKQLVNHGPRNSSNNNNSFSTSQNMSQPNLSLGNAALAHTAQGLSSVIYHYIQLAFINLSEIVSLVGSQSLPGRIWLEIKDVSVGSFIEKSLNLMLLCVSFMNLSDLFEEIKRPASLVINQITSLFLHINTSAPDQINLIMFQTLNKILQKEIGIISKGTVNLRIFERIKDNLCIERINQILSFVDDQLFRKKDLIFTLRDLVCQLGEILLFIVYFSDTPLLIKNALKTLQPLCEILLKSDKNKKTPFFDLRTVFDFQYIIQTVANKDEVVGNLIDKGISFLKPSLLKKSSNNGGRKESSEGLFSSSNIAFETIEVPVGKPELKQELNYFTLLAEKLGKTILNSQENSLSQVLQSEIEKHHIFCSGTQPTVLDLGNPNSNPIKIENNQSAVLLHLFEEEELSWLVKVLFYWEEVNPTFTKSYPKTVEEYLADKEAIKEQETLQQQQLTLLQQQQQQQQQLLQQQQQNQSFPFQYKDVNESGRQIASSQSVIGVEKLFSNLPDFNLIEDRQENLPLGWQLNYEGLYNDLIIPRGKQNGNTLNYSEPQIDGKRWNMKGIVDMERKFEELSLQIENFKDTDKQEDKIQTILAKNFVQRMQEHIQMAQLVCLNLNDLGMAILFNFMENDQCEQLLKLASYGLNNQLQAIVIPAEITQEDLRKQIQAKLPIPTAPQIPNFPVQNSQSVPPPNPPPPVAVTNQPPPQNIRDSNNNNNNNNNNDQANVLKPGTKSNLILSICDFSAVTKLRKAAELSKVHSLKQMNSNSTIFTHCRSGCGSHSIINDIIDFFKYIKKFTLSQNTANLDPVESFVNESIHYMRNAASKQEGQKASILEILTPFEQKYLTGCWNIFAGWQNEIYEGARVFLKNMDEKSQDDLIVLGGGRSSGIQNCNLISVSDNEFIHHNVLLENVEAKKIVLDQIDFLSLETQEKLIESLNTIISEFNQLTSLGSEKRDQTISAKMIKLGLMLKSLLKFASQFNWDTLYNSVDGGFKKKIIVFISLIKEISIQNPEILSENVIESKFSQIWEIFIEKMEREIRSLTFYSPFSVIAGLFLEDQKQYEFLIEPNDQNLMQTQSSLQSNEVENSTDYVTTASSFLESLPDSNPPIKENKLLKHWQKYVLPKIEGYVKSSFKPIQMEQFFEQMKIELRKYNQHGAARVAYIICESKLPNGVILPDFNHDWSTITIEQVRAGMKLFTKLQENSTALVEVISIDVQNSNVLVWYHDQMMASLVSLWVPVSNLKVPEIPLQPPANFWTQEKLQQTMIDSILTSVGSLSRQLILSFLNFEAQSDPELFQASFSEMNFSVIDIIKTLIAQEISHDPITGWLDMNQYAIHPPERLLHKHKSLTNPSPASQRIKAQREESSTVKKTDNKIKQIQNYLNAVESKHKLGEQNQLLVWISDYLPKICQYISKTSYSTDLLKTKDTGIMPLNVFNCSPEYGKISSIAVTFTKAATIYKCTGIKFFTDPLGVNSVKTVSTGRTPKTKIHPMLFKTPEIYASYACTLEELQFYEQGTNTTALPCIVYGIPSEWNTSCWVVDTLGSSFIHSKFEQQAIENFRSLIQVLFLCFEKMSGPCMLKQLLAKLLSRTLVKYRFFIQNHSEYVIKTFYKNSGTPEELQNVHWQLLGLQSAQLLLISQDVGALREREVREGLYSSYCEELMEMVVNFYVPMLKLPNHEQLHPKYLLKSELNSFNWLIGLVNLNLIFNYLRFDSPLPLEIQQSLREELKIDRQWNNLLFVENLPLEWSEQEIKTKIFEILSENKARVFNPEEDLVLMKQNELESVKHAGKAFLLLDGWLRVNLKDDEKAQQVKAVEQEEQQMDQQLWNCPVCTFENTPDIQICCICGQGNKADAIQQVPEVEIVQVQEGKTEQSQIVQQVIEKERAYLEKVAESIKTLTDTHNAQVRAQEIQKIVNARKQEADRIEKEQKEQASIQAPVQEKEVKSGGDQKDAQNDDKSQIIAKPEDQNDQQKNKKKNKNKKDNQEPVPQQQEEQQKEEPKEIKKEQKKEEIPVAVTPQPDSKSTVPEKDKIEAVEPVVEAPLPSPESLVPEKPQCIVLIGKNQIIESPAGKQALQGTLYDRLRNVKAGKTGFVFQEGVLRVLKQIFDDFHKIPEFLAIVGKKLHIDTSKTLQVDVFIDICTLLAQKEPIALWDFFEEIGYDLWLNNSAYASFQNCQIVKLKTLARLGKFLQRDFCQVPEELLYYSPTYFRLDNHANILNNNDVMERPTINYPSLTSQMEYRDLTDERLNDLRYSWSFLRFFNEILKDTVQYVELNITAKNTDKSDIPANAQIDQRILLSIGSNISSYRSIYLSSVQVDTEQKFMQQTAVARDDKPKIKLERMRMPTMNNSSFTGGNASQRNDENSEIKRQQASSRGKGLINVKSKDDYFIGKAAEQLKEIDRSLLRPIKPQGANPFCCFEVEFKGEMVQGEAGPYRQFFADVASELQPNSLTTHTKNTHLLLPTANNQNSIGEFRDRFVINPSAKSTFHLLIFEFLGVLMGCAMRTDTHINIDLPNLFWKQLLGEQFSLEDMDEVNRPLVNILKNMLTETNQEVFEYTFAENFTYLLSDGTQIELKENGAEIPVEFENQDQYVQLVIEAALNESKLQINAVRKGLTSVVPENLLNILTHDELEMRVCGQKQVDIDLLKRNTRYGGGYTDEHKVIKNFWQVLKGFTTQECLRFIKFCWGQERLPANDEEFIRNSIRFMIKPSSYQNENRDQALPKADTCFFNFELPEYSTLEALRERILLAINWDCVTINGDKKIELDPNARHGGSGDGDDDNYDGQRDEY